MSTTKKKVNESTVRAFDFSRLRCGSKILNIRETGSQGCAGGYENDDAGWVGFYFLQGIKI